MQFFNTTVSRTTSFSVESFDKYKNNIDSFFKTNLLFQLSILIASKDLYNDIQKKKVHKVKTALENYFRRAHFNAVPFGTFSKVGILEWGRANNINKSDITFVTLVADHSVLVKELVKTLPTNWKQYTYYTNPTVHFLSSETLSYYKTEITAEGHFKIAYVELDLDTHTQWVLRQFKKSASLSEIINLLKKKGFKTSDIDNYLIKIIEAGLLINAELFPAHMHTKSSLISPINSPLIKERKHAINTENLIHSLAKRLIKEQNKLCSDNTYKSIYMATGYDHMNGNICNTIKEKIKAYTNFTLAFNHQQQPIKNRLLEFGNEFCQHFNDEFVPLSTVFNPKCGLQYGNNNNTTPKAIPDFLFKKIITSNNNPIYMDLPNAGVEDHLLNTIDPTFGVIYELLACEKSGKEIVYFKSVGGGSALKMLGRFTEATEAICEEIAAYEEERYRDQIVAEISMILKPRIFNVLAKKSYYKHIIPLNTVFDETTEPIFLEDLYLKFNGRRFILISKEKQKEVVPRLTSAVNYPLSNFNIYRFLCDLQYQYGELTPVNFNLNAYNNIGVTYIPRIYLKNDILLSPAQLLLVNTHLGFDDFKVYVLELVDLYNFPKKICVADAKGKLTIDLENEAAFLMLHKKVITQNTFYISESLYESFRPQIKQYNEHFVHELYSCIKNTNFKPPSPLFGIKIHDPKRYQNIPILSEWLYLELYCNTYIENEVLKSIIEVMPKTIVCFFFVRYNTPKNHLRVRFKTQSMAAKSAIIKKVSVLKDKHMILKYIIKPYHQEISRYGDEKLMDLSEKIFHLDSLDTFTQNIQHECLDEQTIFIQAIQKINHYFTFFNLSLDEMIAHCELSVSQLAKEFLLDKKRRKSFNKSSQTILKHMTVISYPQFLEMASLKLEVNASFKKDDPKKKAYISDIIHMSMNRLFTTNQRFNEFKAYYLTLNYLKRLKFTISNN